MILAKNEPPKAVENKAPLDKQNAKQFPEIYYCRHMMPGIARYEDYDVATGSTTEDRLYIDTDTMKANASSMVGKPIYVFHQKVDLDNLKEQAHGYVVDCFYNELDGWLWAKMLIVDDEAHKAIVNGWSVSNAYIPKNWDGAGTHLNVDYDRKIRNYEFTHLAIVPNPRYEEAKVFSPDQFKAYQEEKRRELDEMRNSNDKPKGDGLMFFRNKREEVKAEEMTMDALTEVTNADGTKDIVSAAQLIENYRAVKVAAAEAEKKNAKKNTKEMCDEDEVDIDGEMVNMSDLKKCWSGAKANEKKNAEEAKKNEAEEEEEKKKEDEAKEKENEAARKRVNEVANAGGKKVNSANTGNVETMLDKTARGQKRY